MRNSVNTLALLALFLLCSPTSSAEPTARINYLMSDPMSVFDWGFYQLRSSLNGVSLPNGPKVITFSNYNWDKNRIEIFMFSMTSAENKSTAQQWCRAGINAVRKRLGINPHTGNPYFGKTSLLGSYFSHIDFERTDSPKGIPKELDDITNITTQFSFGGKSTNHVKCQGPLRSSKIFIEE